MMKAWIDKASGEFLGIFDDFEQPAEVDENLHDIIDLPPEMTDGLHEWDPVARAPVRHLPTAKLIAHNTVNTVRDNLQNGSVPTPFGLIDGNDSSKIKIAGLVSMAQILGDQFSTTFTLADDTDIEVDAPTMINLGLAVGQFVANCHTYARTLKVQIDAVTTVEELDAINLAAGWPGG